MAQAEREEWWAMIIEGRHRVAVATKDGKVISDHFGSAPLFVVYEVDGDKVLDKELRVNTKKLARGQEASQAGCWDLIQELLPDVRVVISRGMGENAYVGLLRRNVLPITAGVSEADEALHAYLHGRLEEDRAVSIVRSRASDAISTRKRLERGL